MKKSENKDLAYELDLNQVNFRQRPHIYKVDKAEQGILLVEPYKSELLPYWRFRTPAIAKKSSLKIYRIFLEYKNKHDFIGMDMARKFLEMGYTRSRRYANHASGRKYETFPLDAGPNKNEHTSHIYVLSQDVDWGTNEKAHSARFFYEQYMKVMNDAVYKRMTKDWIRRS